MSFVRCAAYSRSLQDPKHQINAVRKLHAEQCPLRFRLEEFERTLQSTVSGKLRTIALCCVAHAAALAVSCDVHHLPAVVAAACRSTAAQCNGL